MKTPEDLLADIYAPEFTPVPLLRNRSDGWTPDQQRRFIVALMVMGSTGRALKAVGMSRNSLSRLKMRADAGSFVAACRRALQSGRDRVYAIALDRAINGVTTITVTPGGRLRVTDDQDPDMLREALRPDPFEVRHRVTPAAEGLPGDRRPIK